jgi:ketosteroid isomerase-like protein
MRRIAGPAVSAEDRSRRSGLAAELGRLGARLRDLEALADIENLHRTFTRAVADRQFGTLSSYFTSDGVIDMRRHGEKRGRDAIKGHFDGMGAVPLTGAGYLLSSPVVQVSGEVASGVWSWHRFLANGTVAGRPVRVWGVWEEGRYRCSYRRTEDGWRFSEMQFRVVRPDHDDDPPRDAP